MYQKDFKTKSEGHQNKDGFRETIEVFKQKHPFKTEWVSNAADEELISFSEAAGKYMAPMDKFKKEDKQALSKSQIRNVFGEIKRIQQKGICLQESYTSFLILKPKVAYANGRNKSMGMELFKWIFDEGWEVVNQCKDNSRKQIVYNNFCNVLESILAYHKAYGGKD